MKKRNRSERVGIVRRWKAEGESESESFEVAEEVGVGWASNRDVGPDLILLGSGYSDQLIFMVYTRFGKELGPT